MREPLDHFTFNVDGIATNHNDVNIITMCCYNFASHFLYKSAYLMLYSLNNVCGVLHGAEEVTMKYSMEQKW